MNFTNSYFNNISMRNIAYNSFLRKYTKITKSTEDEISRTMKGTFGTP